MIKVQTIEQFKVLEHIKKNFFTKTLNIEIIDSKSLKITDREGASMTFSYKDEEISEEYL